MGGRPWLCGLGLLVASLALAACAGGKKAARAGGPRLSRVCFGQVPHGLQTETSWLWTADGIRLFAFTSGTGTTGVVLAHESPGGACGWLPGGAVLHGPRPTRARVRLPRLPALGERPEP